MGLWFPKSFHFCATVLHSQCNLSKEQMCSSASCPTSPLLALWWLLMISEWNPNSLALLVWHDGSVFYTCLLILFSGLTELQYFQTHLTLQGFVHPVSSTRMLFIFLCTGLISILSQKFPLKVPALRSLPILHASVTPIESWTHDVMVKCLLGFLLYWTLSFVRVGSIPCLLLCFP